MEETEVVRGPGCIGHRTFHAALYMWVVCVPVGRLHRLDSSDGRNDGSFHFVSRNRTRLALSLQAHPVACVLVIALSWDTCSEATVPLFTSCIRMHRAVAYSGVHVVTVILVATRGTAIDRQRAGEIVHLYTF